jgi:hypothetical protein
MFCKGISCLRWYNRLLTGAEILHIYLLRNLHCGVPKLEISRLKGGMLLTLKSMNALASRGENGADTDG